MLHVFLMGTSHGFGVEGQASQRKGYSTVAHWHNTQRGCPAGQRS